MNSYTGILAGAEDEVREFANSDDGAPWDAKWYKGVSDLVRRIREQSTDEEAERLLDMLMWMIVDSGPLGKGFGRSIDQAADAMQRKRKRAHIERRVERNR